MIRNLIHKYYSLFPTTQNEDMIDVSAKGDKIKVVIPNQCGWLSKTGGCTFCSYSSRNKTNASALFRLNENQILSRIKNIGSNFSIVDIYMNGSFFNSQESTIESQDHIIDFFVKNFGVTKIRVESRPEFINKDRVIEITNKFKIRLEIGIGLETTNDEIRTKSINKGFTFKNYLDKYDEIKDICDVRTYLTLKPPFISEYAAIEDCFLSVKELVDRGIYNIGITPIVIYENSLMQFLVEEYLYRPVWLWSLIELNQKIFNSFPDFDLKITGLEFIPEPLLKPSNCEKCSAEIMKMLAQNNKLKWDNIDNECDCKKIWESEIRNNNASINIENEIQKALEKLNKIESRSVSIAEKFTCQKDIFLKDVVKEVPKVIMDLNGIGIADYKKNISYSLLLNNENIIVSSTSVISAKTSLDAFHRGIHMSRIVEMVENISHIDLNKLEEEFVFILNQLKESQNSVNAQIKIETELFLPTKTFTTNKDTKICSLIAIDYEDKNREITKNLTISFPILNACPCTLYNSKQLLNESYTHTQRGTVQFSLSQCDINISSFYKFLFDNLFYPISLLKREDEMELVKNIFVLPEFCEDICRRLAQKLLSDFNGSQGNINVSVKTLESIHNHNVESNKFIHF